MGKGHYLGREKVDSMLWKCIYVRVALKGEGLMADAEDLFHQNLTLGQTISILSHEHT